MGAPSAAGPVGAAVDPAAARLARTAAAGRAITAVRLVNAERAEALGRLGVRSVADELYNVIQVGDVCIVHD